MWKKEKEWWAAQLLTCSGLICSDVGKTSGYGGRSKTRSSASSCCWVKASALRCFRKLSTLPWESLCGPEPSEPSTRRESNNRDTDPGKLAFVKLCTSYSSPCFFLVFFPVPPLWETRGGQEKDGVLLFQQRNDCSEPLATSYRLFPLPPPSHCINTTMIWKPSGNWWITCKYIHVVASMYTNESSSSPFPAKGFCFFFHWCSMKSRARFFFVVVVVLKYNFPFAIQYCFHSLWVCGSIWEKTAAEDKRLNKIVQSGSIILLSKHGNLLLTPDLITQLLGEGCLGFSRYHLCAMLWSLLQTILPYLHPSALLHHPPPLLAAVAVSAGLLPRSHKASAPLQICHSKFAADYVLPSVGEPWYMICKAPIDCLIWWQEGAEMNLKWTSCLNSLCV